MMVRDRGQELTIFCKAWRVRNATGRFAKTEFTLDFTPQQLTCPHGIVMGFEPGRTVHVPAQVRTACPLRHQGTTNARGPSVSIHPNEQLLAELRQRQQAPEGQAMLRQHTTAEHGLAHLGHWQGHRARYRGTRKNLFDLHRTAVVHNLHVIARHDLLNQDAA